MKNTILKAFLLATASPAIPLQAQTTPILGDLVVSGSFSLGSPSGPNHMAFRNNGVISAKGEQNVWGDPSLLPADQLGTGSQLMWQPILGAFRAGTFTMDNLDPNQIGPNSIAMGYNAWAGGWNGIAMGAGAVAAGQNSVAIGSYNYAYDDWSIAIGSGNYAGGSYGSVAIGYSNSASGSYSSMATGFASSARGSTSTAMGKYSSADGDVSAAIGFLAKATSLGSTVVGMNNVGGGSSYEWIGTDPLFEIGNGMDPGWFDIWSYPQAAPSNAMTVYKNGNVDLNGNVTVQGVITCTPGGNIPMFTGN
jgi:hypothetical protein